MMVLEMALIALTIVLIMSYAMRWSTASYRQERYWVPEHKTFRLFNILFWFFTTMWVLMLGVYIATLATAT